METNDFINKVRETRTAFNRTEVYLGREMKAFYVSADTYEHLLRDKPPELYIEVTEDGVQAKLFGKPLFFVQPRSSMEGDDYFDFSSGRR